jgi:VWFA-related protein
MTRLTAFAGTAVVCCAAVVPCVAGLQADAAAPDTQQPTTQPPSFRAGTVLVEVDAIVTDSSGRFVSDLTRDDFDVFEDGVRQRIDRLYRVSGTAVIPSVPGGTSESVPATSAPAVAPARVFVLLIDREHMQAGSFKRLQQAAITFLSSQFQPGDVGGVVIGDTMAGNHLTSNRYELIAAVGQAKPDFSRMSRRFNLFEWPRFSSEAEAVRIALSNDGEALQRVVRRACSEDPGTCRQGADVVEPLVRAKAQNIVGEMRPPAARTVRSLQALAAGLGRFPGRKTIVLMSDGFFVEESWADLRQIVGAAARSNVRIYSIDTRALDTRQASDFHQVGPADPDGRPPLDAYNTIEDGPNMLAVDTGGYAIRNANDFAGALSEIARDTSQYYVVGYEPARPATDGSFRTIALRVRRPGLSVRARRGYLAASGSHQPGTRQPQTREPTPPNVGAPETALASLPISAGVPEMLLPRSDAGLGSPGGASVERPAEPSGFALRPDSSDRIRELAAREGQQETEANMASRGWDHYRRGDLEGAAELLRQAAAEPGAHAWVYYVLGYSELGLRHIDCAAQQWERVRALVPGFRPVYLDLGDAYLQLGNFTRAIDVLKSAATRWTGDVDVMNAIGTIQVRRGALADAIRTFEAAIAANPGDALAYFNLARTHELRYFKLRRYSAVEGRWLGSTSDLTAARANYASYVRMGGPYAQLAKEALQNLAWLR